MDSLTQITLGAAVGEATLGSKVGKKAPLWGAALGTLPDLDVLVNPFVSEVTALAIHRGFSHSLLFIVLATPLFGWLLHRLHRSDAASARGWGVLVFLTLATHVLLDCLTSYGTQVFYPFSDYPVIFATVFIIDPLYTVPLLIGLVVALTRTPGSHIRRTANYAGLALSSLYLLLTVANKLHMDRVFADALAEQDHTVERVFTKPMPLTNLYWSAIAEDSTGFWIGYYSLFDDARSIRFSRVPKNHDLLADAWDTRPVQQLRTFSRGYFTVTQRNGNRYVHDLRFGRSDLGLRTGSEAYVFTFRLKETPESAVVGFEQRRPSFDFTTQTVRHYLARIAGTVASPSVRASSPQRID